MKKFLFLPGVPTEIRAIAQPVAIGILKAIHRYAETGRGDVKPLSGELDGLLRLRVGRHRVLFEETHEVIVIHHVRPRKNAYQ